jgi:uncharacterized membrane protein YidH (DUF202 family)
MKYRTLETRIAQLAMVLTLAGSTIRVLHLFDENSSNVGYTLLGAGILLMTIAVILRSRHNKQMEKQEQKEKNKQLNHN